MLHFSPLIVAIWIPAWAVLLGTVTFIFFSHRLIQGFYDRLRPVLLDRPRFVFRRLEQALMLLGLLALLSVVKSVFYFTIAFVLIVLAAESILKPGGDAQLAMPITDRSDELENARKLKEAVVSYLLYEDADLSLTTLALKLNIHPHDLSLIINT